MIPKSLYLDYGRCVGYLEHNAWKAIECFQESVTGGSWVVEKSEKLRNEDLAQEISRSIKTFLGIALGPFLLFSGNESTLIQTMT